MKGLDHAHMTKEQSKYCILSLLIVTLFSNEEKVAVVVPVTSVEVTCSVAMIALSFSTLLVKCLMKILGRSALG